MGRLAILFLLLLSVFAGAETMPTGSIEIFSSSEVTPPITRSRAELALKLVRSRLAQPDQPVPNIVVLYASQAAASAEGLPSGRGIIVTRVTGSVPLYHLWIIGTHEEEKLVYGLISILNIEWGLTLSSKEIETHRQHVSRNLSSTVAVNALARP